jgi:hypothetical protein
MEYHVCWFLDSQNPYHFHSMHHAIRLAAKMSLLNSIIYLHRHHYIEQLVSALLPLPVQIEIQTQMVIVWMMMILPEINSCQLGS